MKTIEAVSPQIAVITHLAKRIDAGRLGRTSLMKLLYFLQEVKQVPLDYEFTLYSYGPFDSGVLSDLGTAESLQAVRSDVELFSGGYRYKIQGGPEAEEYLKRGDAFLRQYREQIDWVVENFAKDSPSDLELLSTIAYADRNAEDAPLDRERLSSLVHGIKPKFPISYIGEKIDRLAGQGLLVNFQ